ncbi:MAG: hypothetical protein P8X61_12960 [Limibacillus sp.]
MPIIRRINPLRRSFSLLVLLGMLGACAYSNERLFEESQGQITVSSTGVVQASGGEREAQPENAPLVIIRFDQPEVAYGGPLGQVVEKVRAARPGAGFDVVAVSPSIGSEEQVADLARRGRQRGEQVYRTLLDLGLQPADLSLASTVSTAVMVNEVHIYLR